MLVCGANHKSAVSLIFKFPSPVANFPFFCLIYRLKILQGKETGIHPEINTSSRKE